MVTLEDELAIFQRCREQQPLVYNPDDDVLKMVRNQSKTQQ